MDRLSIGLVLKLRCSVSILRSLSLYFFQMYCADLFHVLFLITHFLVSGGVVSRSCLNLWSSYFFLHFFYQLPLEIDPWKSLREHILSDYINHEVISIPLFILKILSICISFSKH